MPLIDLKTSLKDLKFGHDGVDGSSSKEPFVRTKIPANNESSPSGLFGSATGGPDFLIRGGLLLPRAIVNDEVRLFKFFIDLESPRGLLFTLKQNFLSRTNVKTKGTSGPLSGFLNQGLYTPLSTLLAAASSPLGIYPNKQGLNPFDDTFYANAMKREILDDADGTADDNRLVQLTNAKIYLSSNYSNPFNINGIINLDDKVNILSYSGGPNSILGIGKTNIKFATSNVGSPLRTGLENDSYKELGGWFFNGAVDKTISTEQLFRGEILPIPTDNFNVNLNRFLGASSVYGFSVDSPYLYNRSLANVIDYNFVTASLNTKTLIPLNSDKDGKYGNGAFTFTPSLIRDISTNESNLDFEEEGLSSYIGPYNLGGLNIQGLSQGTTAQPGDFRRNLRKLIKSNTFEGNVGGNPFGTGEFPFPKAPNYYKANIEQRVNLGDPGRLMTKNIDSYVTGKKDGASSLNSFDKINALPIYNSSNEISEFGTDLVDFRIGVVNNDVPNSKTYIHFRAFLDQISDAYSSNWDATKYIGRGENFYTYSGFDRQVSLSWTVSAQSKIELIPMYRKLNYLASICAPDYNASGYMRGNIITLTIGGYFYEQYGIIKGFTYDMNSENDTWEIGIGDDEFGTLDHSVKPLPHTIRVKGFNFIPIHNFVPRKQQFSGKIKNDGSLDQTYGPERFISLENSFGNLWGSPYSNNNTSSPTPINAVPLDNGSVPLQSAGGVETNETANNPFSYR